MDFLDTADPSSLSLSPSPSADVARVRYWRQTFFCFLSEEASNSAALRWELFQRGCHMVCECMCGREFECTPDNCSYLTKISYTHTPYCKSHTKSGGWEGR